jgi:hypothetical protein
LIDYLLFFAYLTAEHLGMYVGYLSYTTL